MFYWAAKLEFFSKDRGVFHYNTNLYGRGAIEIVPAATSVVHPITGVWADSAMVGSGFTLQMYQGDALTMFWYCYDTQGNQLWFTCEANLYETTTSLTIYEVTALEWMYWHQLQKTKAVGRAIVTPYQDKLIFKYEITSSTIEATGIQTLSRIF